MELSSMFGFRPTDNLGKYLGVPLLHEKCKVSNFQYIFDRMNQRLNGWKSHCLSLVGRITLTKSALASIPNYVMQTMKLPANACSKIDKLCRNFVWGSSETRKKIHLVSWKKLCSPKKDGGLSFRKAKDFNLACMMKLAWGIVSKLEALSVKVLRSKYGCSNDMLPVFRNRTRASNAWRGIMSIWPQFRYNLIWRVGNGQTIKI